MRTPFAGVTKLKAESYFRNGIRGKFGCGPGGGFVRQTLFYDDRVEWLWPRCIQNVPQKKYEEKLQEISLHENKETK